MKAKSDGEGPGEGAAGAEKSEDKEETERKKALYIKQLEQQMLKQHQAQLEILNSLRAEPLPDRRPYQETAEVAGWRKRKVRNIQTRKMNPINEESSECGSDLPGDSDENE